MKGSVGDIFHSRSLIYTYRNENDDPVVPAIPVPIDLSKSGITCLRLFRQAVKLSNQYRSSTTESKHDLHFIQKGEYVVSCAPSAF
jgi:hypothetical protein